MRIAILIVGLLGALIAGGVGAGLQEEMGRMSQQQRQMAVMMGQGALVLEMEKLESAAMIMILGAVVGVLGAILAFVKKFAIGGGLMLAVGILLALFAPRTLLGTSVLLVAGVLAPVAHRMATANPAPTAVSGTKASADCVYPASKLRKGA